MSSIKFKRGQNANLNQVPIKDGSILFTEDGNSRIYLDTNGERKEIHGNIREQVETRNFGENNTIINDNITAVLGDNNIIGGMAYQIAGYGVDTTNNKTKFIISNIDENVTQDWIGLDVTATLDYWKPRLGQVESVSIDGTNATIVVNQYWIEKTYVNDTPDSNGWFTLKTGTSYDNWFTISDHPEWGNIQIGKRAFAAGYENSATMPTAVAIGRLNTAQAKYTATIGGVQNINEAYSGFVTGYRNKAYGDQSHVEGNGNVNKQHQGHVEGWNNIQEEGRISHTEGGENINRGILSHVEGANNTIEKEVWTSHVEGRKNTIAEGALNSHIEGYNNKIEAVDGYASNDLSTNHVEGIENIAASNFCHAEGYKTKTYGSVSHSEGNGTQALGGASHAEGLNTIASGNYSHAEGNGNKVYGKNGHGEGQGNTITVEGISAHAEGKGTTASNTAAHAEGENTVASGYNAHAEGYQTEASGDQSHTQNAFTKATGLHSSAAGTGTIAGYAQQFVVGKYNSNKNDTLFEVGNGSSSKPSNAFEVKTNGTVYSQEGKLATENFVNSKVGKPDWNESDSSTNNYIKNRTHYGASYLVSEISQAENGEGNKNSAQSIDLSSYMGQNLKIHRYGNGINEWYDLTVGGVDSDNFISYYVPGVIVDGKFKIRDDGYEFRSEWYSYGYLHVTDYDGNACKYDIYTDSPAEKELDPRYIPSYIRQDIETLKAQPEMVTSATQPTPVAGKTIIWIDTSALS